ncbi:MULTISPECIES: hypothetical protein [unclassified Lentimonas]|uniref:hypothetical protein n=1 Tax=unclassified Lentimonas TaxID=2630993 RepID=UPI001328B6B4|nr:MULTISPECIES: hypothetical protein [unclassified Lentimonas]CAA6676889.1 Unannotated [Lentimonas sp. CC4]CAA6686695.1 Unannotated [Lentimonas sp. CC6]CAA7075728.1 Unannotated [Lentimonas sp. CC4]CAA7168113.1 Unannotated [Lentimonas sp. CC21]CAA7181739.1 Unannotated [Lentimonas sp. CC8]
MATITICDERVGSEKEVVLTLNSLTETLTVRELIRQRVYQEVEDYNRQLIEAPSEPLRKLLVTPTKEEQHLNSKASKIAKGRVTSRRAIDWELQFQEACKAFERNGFFVLVGDCQVESLDQAFSVKVDTDVTFIKLVALVGG